MCAPATTRNTNDEHNYSNHHNHTLHTDTSKSSSNNTTSTTTTTSTRNDATTSTPTMEIPEPPFRHIILPPSPTSLPDDDSISPIPPIPIIPRSGIFVMGDVHGCYDEMILLYQKAVEQNHHQLFHYVILVGDICNKGPQSMKVIRHMQQHETDGWMCIRGNHENAVLRAYLEMNTSSTSSSPSMDDTKLARYQWLRGEEEATTTMTVAHSNNDNNDNKNNNNNNDATMTTPSSSSSFTQKDFEWMSQLPYTIRIPAHHTALEPHDETPTKYHTTNHHPNNDVTNGTSDTSRHCHDIVVVHAGLIPGIPIEENDIHTMVVLRDLSVPFDHNDDDTKDETDNRTNDTLPNMNTATPNMKSVPWASIWDGPEFIVFGHDAQRGLQQYPLQSPLAMGLDTGCVYGKQLTGMILPSRTIVQVDALNVHVPIVEQTRTNETH